MTEEIPQRDPDEYDETAKDRFMAEYTRRRVRRTLWAQRFIFFVLGVVFTLLFFQFPEVTGWTIERAYESDVFPL
jgi:hypothetical protein